MSKCLTNRSAQASSNPVIPLYERHHDTLFFGPLTGLLQELNLLFYPLIPFIVLVLTWNHLSLSNQIKLYFHSVNSHPKLSQGTEHMGEV